MRFLRNLVIRCKTWLMDKVTNKRNKKVILSQTLMGRGDDFELIAVRCNSKESTGKRKMTPDLIYYLLDGYDIKPTEVIKTRERTEHNYLYDDFYTGTLKGKPHLQISAIVGQNGSGKSSIVEFIMRLVNNFASATLGEKKQGPAATRLHYIDKVDGELWYAQGLNVYHLAVKNAHVSLTLLKNVGEKDGKTRYAGKKEVFDNRGDDECTEVINLMQGEESEARLKEIYSHFFYSLVSNQSIYAYNTNDFKKECNSIAKESMALGVKKDGSEYTVEECNWLHGIFHKNDGYQTPIVITPFRDNGNIDINKENHLALERLVTLLARQKGLRIINGHLKAESLTYSYETDTYYGFRAVKSLGYVNLTEKGYQSLRNDIVKAWSDVVGEDIKKHQADRAYYEQAIDYLVYKTLKISKQYKQHNEFHHIYSQMTDEYDIEAVKKLVQGESMDYSHITRKAMQTLAYFLFNIFTLEAKYDEKGKLEANDTTVSFDELGETWEKATEERIQDVLYMPLWSHIRMCALTIPPFFSMRINLCEADNESVKIDFETLSSGEKQQIFNISSILYHLDNLDSASIDKSNESRILYHHVNVVLEEIELYYHPEMQQQFVEYLIKGIDQMILEHINGIHVMIVTHSPYVLSDIPRSNVLALKKDEEKPVKGLRTFGANIHDMLKDSFFLQGGSIGNFAQWEVGHLMAVMKVYKWIDEEKDENAVCPYLSTEDQIYKFLRRYEYVEYIDGRPEKRLYRDDFKKDFSAGRLLMRIDLFDEPVLKNILLEEFHRTFPSYDKGYKAAKLKELYRQIKELEEEQDDVEA